MTVGLLRHLLGFPVEPERAFMALAHDAPYAVWWDDHGDRGTQVSFLALATPLTASARDDLRATHAELSVSPEVRLEGFPLGIVVVAPYETGAQFLDLGADTLPPVHALIVDRLVAIDHATGATTLVALGDSWSGELEAWRRHVEGALAEAPELLPPHLAPVVSVIWRDTPDRYREMITQAQNAIREGDAYQLCVTTQIDFLGSVDAVALHRLMRVASPTHHQALIRLGEITIVCASPETFLDVSPEGFVVTRPIKGTRPRGQSPEEDRRLAEELLASEKERAENLMIVDLMRNDLSKVCVVGSVAVPELLVVETYATVHQLVSTVGGDLQEGVDVWDVVEATFPAGSMTGAPKRRAVELLQDIESGPRGLYSGVIGIWRADGSATFAMTIRSAIVYATHLTLGVGGGITALSETEAEIREVGVKAAAFLEALGQQQAEYSW